MPAREFGPCRGATRAAERAAPTPPRSHLGACSGLACFDSPAIFFTPVSAKLLPASKGLPLGTLTKKLLPNFLMLSLSQQGHGAVPVCRRHCQRLSILEPHPSSRPASLALPCTPSLFPQLPGKRAQLETALPLIGITFYVSFSAARFPPHLPIVSTLLIATFNSLCPGSPRAAAAIKTWGPSAPRHCFPLQTKDQPNEALRRQTSQPIRSHSCSWPTP